ncbi:MAG: hypothetical protein Q9181_007038 [Wetmoreana brouardii]
MASLKDQEHKYALLKKNIAGFEKDLAWLGKGSALLEKVLALINQEMDFRERFRIMENTQAVTNAKLAVTSDTLEAISARDFLYNLCLSEGAVLTKEGVQLHPQPSNNMKKLNTGLDEDLKARKLETNLLAYWTSLEAAHQAMTDSWCYQR